MHIITAVNEIERRARRDQKRTVIEELRRRGIRYEVAHDGRPVVHLSEGLCFRSVRAMASIPQVESLETQRLDGRISWRPPHLSLVIGGSDTGEARLVRRTVSCRIPTHPSTPRELIWNLIGVI